MFVQVIGKNKKVIKPDFWISRLWMNDDDGDDGDDDDVDDDDIGGGVLPCFDEK